MSPGAYLVEIGAILDTALWVRKNAEAIATMDEDRLRRQADLMASGHVAGSRSSASCR
jgi:hypothetical protein